MKTRFTQLTPEDKVRHSITIPGRRESTLEPVNDSSSASHGFILLIYCYSSIHVSHYGNRSNSITVSVFRRSKVSCIQQTSLPGKTSTSNFQKAKGVAPLEEVCIKTTFMIIQLYLAC